jgi:anti-sigma regulatory factor (Ser/Thr protein kinase)
MNDLSLHILDIAQNSIRAKAKNIFIIIDFYPLANQLGFTIEDDGHGMDKETLARAINPFYTTRTTRKFGLGLSLLQQSAAQTGGKLDMQSTKGKGTKVSALFMPKHIDCPVLGDLAATISVLFSNSEGGEIHFCFNGEQFKFELSTIEVKSLLETTNLAHPKIIAAIRNILNEELGNKIKDGENNYLKAV